MTKRTTVTKAEPEVKAVSSGKPTPLTLEALVAYIEKLKAKNPVKYESKRAELEARLLSFG